MSNAPQMLNEEALDKLVKSIGIPPRPSLLADVQHEMGGEDPDPRRIAQLVAKDVAMSAALLKSANSVFFGLKRKAETVEQAAAFLGLTQVSSLLMGLITRQAIKAEGPALSGFWDAATQRSLAMSKMAKAMRACPPDLAHTFGLFCDIGIPMLMSRFPDYHETLSLARGEFEQLFTDIEDQRHGTNHTIIGAILARSWGLSQEVMQAIRSHHDYAVMLESGTPHNVAVLIALGVLAEKAIQAYQGNLQSPEWEKGGDQACDILGIAQHEAEDWCDELALMFNAEH
ncbi:HDOD domain-containing protein [Massilia sp. W12]|uniref:HDOD domain-containing protein n=1 Tax=Massilia sp. W12 TaxID=3126507 RepID=UPI0030D256E4